MLIDMSASTMEMAPKKSDNLSLMNSALSGSLSALFSWTRHSACKFSPCCVILSFPTLCVIVT